MLTNRSIQLPLVNIYPAVCCRLTCQHRFLQLPRCTRPLLILDERFSDQGSLLSSIMGFGACSVQPFRGSFHPCCASQRCMPLLVMDSKKH